MGPRLTLRLPRNSFPPKLLTDFLRLWRISRFPFGHSRPKRFEGASLGPLRKT